MAESVKALPPDIQDMIEVYEWDLRTVEGVDRFKKIGAKSLPSIAMDGRVVYASIIPGQEKLSQEIFLRYQDKNI